MGELVLFPSIYAVLPSRDDRLRNAFGPRSVRDLRRHRDWPAKGRCVSRCRWWDLTQWSQAGSNRRPPLGKHFQPDR